MPRRNVERGAVGGFGFTKPTGLVMSHRADEKFVELGLCAIRHVLTNSQVCSYGYTGAESRSIPWTLLNAIYGLCARAGFREPRRLKWHVLRINASLRGAGSTAAYIAEPRKSPPPGVRCFAIHKIALK